MASAGTAAVVGVYARHRRVLTSHTHQGILNRLRYYDANV